MRTSHAPLLRLAAYLGLYLSQIERLNVPRPNPNSRFEILATLINAAFFLFSCAPHSSSMEWKQFVGTYLNISLM